MKLTEEEKKLGNLLKNQRLINSINTFFFQTYHLYGDINFYNKNVLDIGGGAGLYSFYAAIKGAAKVICLEPFADGSNNQMQKKFKQIKDLMNLETVHLINNNIQNYTSEEKFDIVISQASINHFDENSCEDLNINENSYFNYLNIFKKIYYIMNNSGNFIISDVSNRNFWGDLGLKNPFVPKINWKIHQPPHIWAKVAKDAGFVRKKVDWTSLNRFLMFKNLKIVNNPFLSYCVGSHFNIFLQKTTK